MYQIRLVIILAIIAAVGAAGCRRHSAEWQRLDLADALMKEAPDSAFAVICAIDTAQLVGESERARYALLKSMAMDKNYIDTTDFSVLQPAIDYYLKKGTPDERLRTLYYKGCILQNAGNDDKAMECFVEAIEKQEYITDTLTLARAYVRHGRLMLKMYKSQEYVEDNIKASKLYEAKHRYDFALKSLSRVLNGTIFLEDKERSDSVFNVIMSNECYSTFDQEEKLCLQKLAYMITFGDKVELKAFLDSFPNKSNQSEETTLDLARAFLIIGEPDSANFYLSRIDQNMPLDNSLKYNILKSEVYESSLDYRNALKYFKEYYADFDNYNIHH